MKKIKEKKGFTLIEIIVVIVIIGVLLGVAVTGVTKYIGQAKARTYETYEKDLEVSTNNMMVECILGKEECEVPSSGSKKRVSLEELVKLGYSENLRDPEGEGFCSESYVVAENKGLEETQLSYEVCLKCSNYESKNKECKAVDDNDLPVCDYTKLAGSSTVWANKKRTISIGCSDKTSGCSNSVFSKTFKGKEGETQKTGSITISDNGGNKTTCAVDVYIDRKLPTCQLEVEGEKGLNGWYSGSVKVKLTDTNDTESGIASYGIGSSFSKRDYNENTEIEVTNGITSIFGYVKDNAGNEGYCMQELKVNNTIPEIKVRMGYQVYPEKETSVITTPSSRFVTGLNKYGNIKGIVIKLNSSAIGNNIVKVTSGSTEIGSSIIADGSNEVRIEIKEGTYDHIVLDLGTNSNLNKISKIELLKEENTTSVWTNKDIEVYIYGKDTITGVKDYSFDEGRTYTNIDHQTHRSNGQGRAVLRDQMGNESNKIIYTITKIDKTPPPAPLLTNSSGGSWTNKDVTVSASSKDSMSGNISTSWQYSYSNAGALNDWKSTSTTQATGVWTTELNTMIYVRVQDNAGNWSEWSNGTAILIDKTPPPKPTLTNSSGGSWTNKDVAVFASSKDGRSGNRSTSWQYRYTSPDVYTTNWKNTTTTQATGVWTAGINTIYVRVQDNAGNWSEWSNGTAIMIDKTAPTCTNGGGNSSWTNGTRTITGKCNDTGGSGCVGNVSIPYTSNTNSTNLSPGVVKDKAGNSTKCASTQTVKIDKTPPYYKTNASSINIYQIDYNGKKRKTAVSNKSCSGNSCKVNIKICRVDGELKLIDTGITFHDDFSGIKTTNLQSNKMYDKNGTQIFNGCLYTSGHNPCNWKRTYTGYDYADNKVSANLTINIDYASSTSDAVCNIVS